MVQPEASVQITVVSQENSGAQINHFTGELKPIAENN
jgi:DNA polymerase/3'-5' exonuclease PolX